MNEVLHAFAVIWMFVINPACTALVFGYGTYMLLEWITNRTTRQARDTTQDDTAV